MEAVADGAEDVVALPVVHVLQLDVADVATGGHDSGGVGDRQVDAESRTLHQHWSPSPPLVHSTRVFTEQ
jgi:hypothetical protein